MADPFARLDATAQAELLRRREVGPTELVEAAIARLERLNPSLNAVVHPALERARRRVAAGVPAGPLAGVPTLMKDIGGLEAGEPCHAGMRVLRDARWTERVDAYFTQKVVQAGLVSLGRTSTPELALLPTTEPEAYGPTRNPWNLNHSAGGSSGGAAAAVAAGIVPVAHASDGGGSIRGPASMCGLVGLKPTRGRCSFGPTLGERWIGFSCEFFVTRSVRDTALLLDLVAGPMPGDPYTAPPPPAPWTTALDGPGRPLRVGVMRIAPRATALHPEALTAVDRTAQALAALGHVVEESHPEALDDPGSVAAYVTVVSSAVARALDAIGEKVGRVLESSDVEPLTWALAENGRRVTAAQLLATIEFVHAFGRRLASWWESGFDLLLTATQAAPPPEIGYITSTREEPFRAFLRAAPYGVCTLPFNMSGQPAISLPVHLTADNLPVGVQLVAPFGREDLLIGVARQLEDALPWRDHLPPLHA
ncbi:MAG TPA: amidase [Candidatus Limnocylindria bacterium]|nr:amidase [Candidatus Limnocylindria bacterium]